MAPLARARPRATASRAGPALVRALTRTLCSHERSAHLISLGAGPARSLAARDENANAALGATGRNPRELSSRECRRWWRRRSQRQCRDQIRRSRLAEERQRRRSCDVNASAARGWGPPREIEW